MSEEERAVEQRIGRVEDRVDALEEGAREDSRLIREIYEAITGNGMGIHTGIVGQISNLADEDRRLFKAFESQREAYERHIHAIEKELRAELKIIDTKAEKNTSSIKQARWWFAGAGTSAGVALTLILWILGNTPG
ncbi:MAG: hypothetical protein R3324_09495 [Halobacteriales archaeon]|nr:hypothetical protein [Halobacteriales archaeon]